MAEQTGSQMAGLHLVVPLEQRLDLGASDAVQGELFVDEGARRPTRGYRGTVASKVAGITYRQLDYWARKQIVEPSIIPISRIGVEATVLLQGRGDSRGVQEAAGCGREPAERHYGHRVPDAARCRPA